MYGENMDAEEQKLFGEFKVALDATQLVSFENHIKPFLEESRANAEELIESNFKSLRTIIYINSAIIFLMVAAVLYLLTK